MDQLIDIELEKPRVIRDYMDRLNIMVSNNQLSTEHIKTIVNGTRTGRIGTTERIQLLMTIVSNQLKSGIRDLKTNKIRYVVGINSLLHSPCPSCRGMGFVCTPEIEMKIVPCPGNEDYGIISCDGSKIKTTVCNRCHGMTLSEILDIRSGIMTGEFEGTEFGRNIIEKYTHLTKLRMRKLNPAFVKKFGNKTFIVISAENGAYYFIPEKPCTACGGTGKFIHDRKNLRCNCGGQDPNCKKCGGKGRFSGTPIQCTGCGGKGHLSKKLIMTGNVKSFHLCDKCKGEGQQRDLGNPVINFKTMPDEVKRELKCFFNHNDQNIMIFNTNKRSEAAATLWPNNPGVEKAEDIDYGAAPKDNTGDSEK